MHVHTYSARRKIMDSIIHARYVGLFVQEFYKIGAVCTSYCVNARAIRPIWHRAQRHQDRGRVPIL